MIQGSIPLPLWKLNNFNENFWFRIDNFKKSTGCPKKMSHSDF